MRPPTSFVRQISDITTTKRAAAIKQEILASLPEGRRRLSPRETDVLRLLAHGHSTSETAAALGVSDDTVLTLIKRASKKLGACNRTHLIAMAIRSGDLDHDLLCETLPD